MFKKGIGAFLDKCYHLLETSSFRVPKILLIQQKGETNGDVVQEKAQKGQERRGGALPKAKFKERMCEPDQKAKRQKEKMTNLEISKKEIGKQTNLF